MTGTRTRYLLIGVFMGIASMVSKPANAQTLDAFAVLPADTFATGPTSGQFIAPANGRIPPFVDKQPVQGFSSAPNGKTLYPILEGSLTTDPDQRRLIINEFDLGTRQYTGRQWWYRLDAETGTGQAIGDFTGVTGDTFLVIERDGSQGPAARFKKIFSVSLEDVDSEGFLIKHEVGDLLQISDPHNIAGGGPVFRFPFVTIESVIPLSRREIGVLNDNNFPFSSGRTPGQPDSNEFIILRLDRPLGAGGESGR